MAAQKFLTKVGAFYQEVLGVIISLGAASNGALVALNASGKLDASVMPTGFGADTQSFPATEAINAGALVNIYNTGTVPAPVFSVRNADRTAAGGAKQAMGFALVAIASGASGTVYISGENTALTGLSPGPYFLGVAGAITQTEDTTTGYATQVIGYGTSAGSLTFKAHIPVICG